MAFRKAWQTASATTVAAVGGWVLYTFPPAGSPFYPQCVFHALTGLDCPGCGTTRALHELLHGNVGAAFALNPMLFAMMFTFLCAIPALARGRSPGFLHRPWFGWTSVVVVIGWWIGRNVV